jgi:NAD(P)H-flavin reductase
MLPARWRVQASRPETGDTTTITLVPDGDDQCLPAPRPGQFLMLSAFGVDEVPISVSGLRHLDDGTVRAVEHTVRAVGVASAALAGLAVGDPVGARGPFGTAWSPPTGPGPIVVMAGGLGLAPLRPLVEELVGRPPDDGPSWLLVGARHPRELCFATDLAGWADGTDLRVLVTVDRADRTWSGQVGVVTHLLDELPFGDGLDATGVRAYICGPEVMMRFSARALIDRGVPATQIQLSAERNMRCAVGHCGHCQLGTHLVCRDGAVFDYPDLEPLLGIREL